MGPRIKQAFLYVCSLFMLVSLPAPVWPQANVGGIPLITNYDFRVTGGSEQNWAITQDHRGIIYVGNNDAGILEYDGVSWHPVPVPGHSIVRSLATGEKGEVYVGTASGFGMLAPDHSGRMQYHSLSGSIDESGQMFTEEWKIYCREGKVYFCTYPNVYIYHTGNREIEIAELSADAYFSFLIDGELYTSDFGLGLMKYTGNRFEPAPGGDAFRERSVTAMVRAGEKELLIGTYFSGIFLYDPETGDLDSTFLDSGLNEYLRTSVITGILSYNNSLVVSTLYNGLAVLDMNGRLIGSITKAEGLIDQTVTSVYAKDGGPLWLTSFTGVSKIEFNSPFRVFTEKQGFEGFITDIQAFSGSLFVSSYGGIYYKKDAGFTTEFIPLEGIDDYIYDLQLFSPFNEEYFLMAIGRDGIYLIDRELVIHRLRDQIDHPSSDPDRRDNYGGFRILQDPDQCNTIYTGKEDLVGLKYIDGQWKENLRVSLSRDRIREMEFGRDGSIWISTYKSVYRIVVSNSLFYHAREYGPGKGLPDDYGNTVFPDPFTGDILIGTTNGFYVYDASLDSMIREDFHNRILPEGRNYIHAFYMDHDGDYWYSMENETGGWMECIAQRKRDHLEIIHQKPFRRLENVSADVFYSDPMNGYWFGKSNELYSYDKAIPEPQELIFHTLLRRVMIGRDSVLFDVNDRFPEGTSTAGPEIRHANANMAFSWAAPFFEKEEDILYAYLLDGFEDAWSDFSPETGHYYNILPPGRYAFKVKAMNTYGDVSTTASFPFRVLPPWYLHFLAFVVYVLMLILIVIALVRFFTMRLKKRAAELECQNIRIEKQRKELETRNREIQSQKEKLQEMNEEVTAQRDEIEAQRDSIMAQKDLINAQKTAITDSIHYARRIQDAVLPSEDVVRFLLPKHFIFYRPQQIVSGDFFWIDNKGENVLLALGDCTGHGVPGAFMSILGISLLNEISGKLTDHSTHEIMDELRDRVMTSLRQTGGRGETWDGMDMGIVSLNTRTRKLQFTGAQHNLYIFRKGELEEIRGDRMPVGIHTKASSLFRSHDIQLERGNCFYLFSDGFPDQFGGEHGKKYGYPRLKAFLGGLQEMILNDQLAALEKEFEHWKGGEEQVDDILMIGVRV